MEAKELRIGNYVLDTFRPLNTVESQIDLDDFGLISNFGPHLLPYKPIRLTEDWLLRFGFVKIGGLYQRFFLGENRIAIAHMDFSCGVYNSKTSYNTGSGFNFKDVRIKHVHQLQNLYFALTGEELTIK